MEEKEITINGYTTTRSELQWMADNWTMDDMKKEFKAHGRTIKRILEKNGIARTPMKRGPKLKPMQEIPIQKVEPKKPVYNHKFTASVREIFLSYSASDAGYIPPKAYREAVTCSTE